MDGTSRRSSGRAYDVVKVLIQNGADVNAVQKQRTAFTGQLNMDMLTL